MADNEQPDVATLTVQLLSAYLANNTVAHTDIADLVRTTKAALIEEKASVPAQAEAPVHTPAVSARKSLAASGHILSLIDGKAYKTLKRHLSKHGLTPDSYRERYNLPATYPMVAPDFAAERRAIAKKIGLGRRPAAAVAASDAPAKPASKTSAKKAKAAPASPRPDAEAKAGTGDRKSAETLKLFPAKTATAKPVKAKDAPRKSPGKVAKPSATPAANTVDTATKA